MGLATSTDAMAPCPHMAKALLRHSGLICSQPPKGCVIEHDARDGDLGRVRHRGVDGVLRKHGVCEIETSGKMEANMAHKLEKKGYRVQWGMESGVA